MGLGGGESTVSQASITWCLYVCLIETKAVLFSAFFLLNNAPFLYSQLLHTLKFSQWINEASVTDVSTIPITQYGFAGARP